MTEQTNKNKTTTRILSMKLFGKSNFVITADESVRGGKIFPLKKSIREKIKQNKKKEE